MSDKQKAERAVPIELGIAGWFLLCAVIWEVIFNRLASSVGLYTGVGNTGLLAWLANSGELALNCAGILAFFLILFTLTRLINSRLFPGLWWRTVLILVSPFYLLVIGWAIIYPVSTWLVAVGYMTAIWSAFFISILAMSRATSNGKRRLVFFLGLAFVLEVFAWIVVDYSGSDQSQKTLYVVASRAGLLAEVLIVASPIGAFFVFFIGNLQSLRSFIKGPHLLGLSTAILVVGFGFAVLFGYLDTSAMLSKVTLKLFGVRHISHTIPFGLSIYMLSLFFGAFFVGCMILPSKKWKRDLNNRRIGIGFAIIWLAGLLPNHVYQFTLVLLGFILIAHSMAYQKALMKAS